MNRLGRQLVFEAIGRALRNPLQRHQVEGIENAERVAEIVRHLKHPLIVIRGTDGRVYLQASGIPPDCERLSDAPIEPVFFPYAERKPERESDGRRNGKDKNYGD